MSKRLLSTERSKVVQLDLNRTSNPGPQAKRARRLVRIHVLGSMRATTYLGTDILPRGKKARAILG